MYSPVLMPILSSKINVFQKGKLLIADLDAIIVKNKFAKTVAKFTFLC